MKDSIVLAVISKVTAFLLIVGIFLTARIHNMFLWMFLPVVLLLATVSEITDSTKLLAFTTVLWDVFLLFLLQAIHAGLGLYLLLALYIALKLGFVVGREVAKFVSSLAALIVVAVLDVGILIQIHAENILYFLLVFEWLFAFASAGLNIKETSAG